VQPLDRSLTFPTNTGQSYSFDESTMWFEVLRYRMVGNGSNPYCITVVLNWCHGQFAFNPNGSISFTPVNDGYQRIQDRCSANSDFIEPYHLPELYSSWRIFLDPIDGPKFHLFAFDGSPEPPMKLLSATPNMLPEQLLVNNTETTILKRSTNNVAPPIHWWHSAVGATLGAMLGVAFLI